MSRKQRLELTWIGKETHAKLEPRVLVAEDNHSYYAKTRRGQGDIFDNYLIYGDNLLSLKAIESEFAGLVKCVFIDPPYNTGYAFKHYNDGIEHSIWLNLMYQRLQILRNLISEDGSIWISIDDNEGHYLKVLMDELFGRKNFICTVVWQKKYTQANDAAFFSDNHDFILVYAKDKGKLRLGGLPRGANQDRAYRNPDNDPRGPWKATPLHAKSGTNTAPFKFQNGVVWKPPPGTFRRFSDQAMKKMEQSGQIWFGHDGSAVPSRKTYLADVRQTVVPKSIWLSDEVGHNHEARDEARAIVPQDPFPTPKPERLLHRILTLATNAGDIVLDSFAGSGTTGAVAHKMGRRWIMIELGEHCHTHIIPRMRKVIDGEDPGGITKAVGWKGGGGFRYYRLAPSLIERDQWGQPVISPAYNAAMLAEAMCKLMGFRYEPSPDVFWQQGRSSERDFIYTTTRTLAHEELAAISALVGDNRTLLICCKAFRMAKPDAFPNLTVKKIPNAVLAKCEWGKDDYSLNVANLPMAVPVEEPAAPARKKRRGTAPDLFDQATAEEEPGA
jgi:adenine-specific DNA-methyltransferase